MSQQGGSKARDLNSRILERIATDPQFRQQLLDDPDQTIANSEFAQEAKQLASQQRTSPLGARAALASGCTWTCAWTD
jgi:hypothetical protein